MLSEVGKKEHFRTEAYVPSSTYFCFNPYQKPILHLVRGGLGISNEGREKYLVCLLSVPPPHTIRLYFLSFPLLPS